MPELDDKMAERLQKEAATLLQSETLKLIVEHLRVRYYNEWKATQTPAAREAVHAQVNGLEAILGTLTNLAEAQPPRKTPNV